MAAGRTSATTVDGTTADRSQPGFAGLLLLADGRFPSGGYAHSGGLEPAVAAGGVRDIASLEQFLIGRAATNGLGAATFAAATCARCADSPRDRSSAAEKLVELDAEFDARTPAPALRHASRTLGRQLLRAATAVVPGPPLALLADALPEGPHQPIALGAAASAIELSPHAAAAAALHEAITGPATAAVRLLGLDPFAVHAVLAGLGPRLDELAAEAAGRIHEPAHRMPASSAVMLDISAQLHATWEARLFAS